VTSSLANHASNHLRLDGARGHGVDPNSSFGEFKRGVFAQTVHGVLAGHVNPACPVTSRSAWSQWLKAKPSEHPLSTQRSCARSSIRFCNLTWSSCDGLVTGFAFFNAFVFIGCLLVFSASL